MTVRNAHLSCVVGENLRVDIEVTQHPPLAVCPLTAVVDDVDYEAVITHVEVATSEDDE